MLGMTGKNSPAFSLPGRSCPARLMNLKNMQPLFHSALFLLVPSHARRLAESFLAPSRMASQSRAFS
jgi:hypothetical protein